MLSVWILQRIPRVSFPVSLRATYTFFASKIRNHPLPEAIGLATCSKIVFYNNFFEQNLMVFYWLKKL